MFKHILVPTDGSALSEGTVARAVSFAKETGARITFFYAQPDFPMPIYGEGALIDPTVDRVLLFAGHMIDKPSRADPRFPATHEANARRAIRAAIARKPKGQA